ETTGVDTDAEPVDPPEPCIADAVRELLVDNCATCHSLEGSGEKAFDDPADLADLIVRGKVVPGDPDASPLYTRVDAGAMPPMGVEPRPSDDDIALLRQWIEEGAAASCDVGPDECGDNDFLDVNWIAELIRQDLLTVEDTDALPFTRYLTLVHHHNRGLCDGEIDPYRHALTKLVNSLSTNPVVTAPLAVEGSRDLIYRLDIRDYNWEKVEVEGYDDAWELIAANNPFALEWNSPDFDFINFLMTDSDVEPARPGTKFPFQPFDSFNETAIRNPDIYHAVVDIPHTLGQLEAQLDVNCDINDDDNLNPLWAGMLKGQSNVSEFNRVIERCEFEQDNNRAYWRSFDFGRDKEIGDEDGVQGNNCKNILDEPIDFCADGGEIIFSLPNGFQAYMIVDGKGQRINEAPSNIVQDPTVPGEVVSNPFSCIGCHNEGIKPKADTVFPLIDPNLFNFEYAQIQDLYGHSELMAQIQIDDKGIYDAAMSQAGVPTDLEKEPIQTQILEFEDGLDAARVAGELQIPHDLLMEKLELIAAFVSPSYKALRVEGGQVSRQDFETDFDQLICFFSYGPETFPEACL
ncbi:MAG: hypothetical protein KC636_38085, partial [Myxococcales bacterium]|nr:hypothetical protein [Myxococcales bacterium]